MRIDKRTRLAIEAVAVSEGWNHRSFDELGILLWALFRYFTIRMKEKFS